MERWLPNLLTVIFAAVFLVSAYCLISYYWQINASQEAYDELIQIVEQAQQEQPTQSADAPSDTPSDTHPESSDPPSLLVELTDPDTGSTAVYGDKLITLSTCEGRSAAGRLVIVAKRIDG